MIQYIGTKAVRNTLHHIATLPRCGIEFDLGRPAALSTGEPARNLEGTWETPAFREFEHKLKHDPMFRAKALGIGYLAQRNGRTLSVEVLQSNAGFYLGTQVDGAPFTRESVEYWRFPAAARTALAKGAWTQKESL